MHQALYRKYRPAVFSDVVGQKHVTDTLQFEVTNGRTSHAYLFTGSRGTGKTSCAKIMAKVLNCENPQNGSPCLKCRMCQDIDREAVPDVVEMDAASHTGVDNIRDITDNVAFTPAMANKKVYIIDEVHMLSKGAFNALLKTIEEPPEHVVFILATTEIHKVPATIVSRCQRFDFHRISMKDIAGRLMYIAEKEGFALEEDAALLIARQAEGGMRDAIGLLELCSSGGADVTAERVKKLLGLSGYETVAKTMNAIADKNNAMLFEIVDDVVTKRSDVTVFLSELISFVRDMLVVRYAENPSAYLDLTFDETELLYNTSKRFTLAKLVYMAKVLDEAQEKLAHSPKLKRVETEITLIRLASPELSDSNDALLARLSDVENAIKLGTVVIPETDISSDSSAVPEPPKPKKESVFAVKETKAEDLIPSTDAPVSAPSEPKGSPTDFSPVSDITAVTDALPDEKRSLVPFLQSAIVSVSADKRVVLIETDSFGAMMLTDSNSQKAIANTFAISGITKGLPDIKVRTTNVRERKAEMADEINKLF